MYFFAVDSMEEVPYTQAAPKGAECLIFEKKQLATKQARQQIEGSFEADST